MGKSEENEEEKWLTHYSSNHQILLVGDGDFSFSLCLATSFASAHNILATSLDHYDEVIKKYTKAKSNLRRLQKLGASVLHGVDATKMKRHTDLTYRKFDRIIFNFPHAGFRGREDNHIMIKHRMLVNGFFSNAKSMLRPYGEIHVNHKTTTPFSDWRLDELASGNSLVLIERVEFKIEDYPSYKQKRGDGPRCDQPFPLGESSTFKFRFSPSHKDKIHGKMEQTLSNSLDPVQSRASHITLFGLNTSQPPWRSSSFEYSYPQPSHTRRTNLDYDRVGLPRTNGIRNTQGNFWNPSLPLGLAPHANEVGLGFNGDMMTIPPQRSWNRGTHILPEFEERTCYRIESCDTESRFGYNRDLMMANHNQRAYYGIDSHVKELRYRLSRDSMTMNQDTCILPETNRMVVINREARLSHERHINRCRTEIFRIVRTYGN